MFRNKLENSTFPSNRPIGGMRISPTNDVMIFPNAAPMIMPTAISRTLPRIANSLNSFNIAALPSQLACGSAFGRIRPATPCPSTDPAAAVRESSGKCNVLASSKHEIRAPKVLGGAEPPSPGSDYSRKLHGLLSGTCWRGALAQTGFHREFPAAPGLRLQAQQGCLRTERAASERQERRYQPESASRCGG